jgi:hypothetical protein
MSASGIRTEVRGPFTETYMEVSEKEYWERMAKLEEELKKQGNLPSPYVNDTVTSEVSYGSYIKTLAATGLLIGGIGAATGALPLAGPILAYSSAAAYGFGNALDGNFNQSIALFSIGSASTSLNVIGTTIPHTAFGSLFNFATSPISGLFSLSHPFFSVSNLMSMGIGAYMAGGKLFLTAGAVGTVLQPVVTKIKESEESYKHVNEGLSLMGLGGGILAAGNIIPEVLPLVGTTLTVAGGAMSAFGAGFIVYDIARDTLLRDDGINWSNIVDHLMEVGTGAAIWLVPKVASALPLTDIMATMSLLPAAASVVAIPLIAAGGLYVASEVIPAAYYAYKDIYNSLDPYTQDLIITGAASFAATAPLFFFVPPLAAGLSAISAAALGVALLASSSQIIQYGQNIAETIDQKLPFAIKLLGGAAVYLASPMLPFGDYVGMAAEIYTTVTILKEGVENLPYSWSDLSDYMPSPTKLGVLAAEGRLLFNCAYNAFTSNNNHVRALSIAAVTSAVASVPLANTFFPEDAPKASKKFMDKVNNTFHMVGETLGIYEPIDHYS